MKLFYISVLFFVLSCSGVDILNPKKPSEQAGSIPLDNGDTLEDPSLPPNSAEATATADTSSEDTPSDAVSEEWEQRFIERNTMSESADKFYVFNSTKYLARVEYNDTLSTIEPYKCIPLMSVSYLENLKLKKVSVILEQKDTVACSKACPDFLDETGSRTLVIDVKRKGLFWSDRYATVDLLQVVHSSCGGPTPSS